MFPGKCAGDHPAAEQAGKTKLTLAFNQSWWGDLYDRPLLCCKDKGKLAMDVIDQGFDDGLTQLQPGTA